MRVVLTDLWENGCRVSSPVNRFEGRFARLTNRWKLTLKVLWEKGTDQGLLFQRVF
jgi:hypothetical protein